MTDWLIVNAEIVNEGRRTFGDISIRDGRIHRIGRSLTAHGNANVLDANGRWLLPGMIDDQVHFREPGLTYKADIESESRACVAGGITSYMEMPNTKPPATNRAALEAKYARAAEVSRVNYAFYLGATNDNLADIRALDPQAAPGIKVFMGASTGNMLVDDPATLDAIFREAPTPIITHCEDTPMILANEEKARERWGDNIPADQHPLIRSREACVKSTKLAIALARKHGTRLHVLHISTARRMRAVRARPGRRQAHHRGNLRALPAFQRRRLRTPRPPHQMQSSDQDRCGPRRDHAQRSPKVASTCSRPITLRTRPPKKPSRTRRAPSGLPLVQYALQCAIERVLDGHLTLERVVEAVSHAPATRSTCASAATSAKVSVPTSCSSTRTSRTW